MTQGLETSGMGRGCATGVQARGGRRHGLGHGQWHQAVTSGKGSGMGWGCKGKEPRGLLPARTRPQGGGAPPLYRPQNGCTEPWVLWAPEILF